MKKLHAVCWFQNEIVIYLVFIFQQYENIRKYSNIGINDWQRLILTLIHLACMSIYSNDKQKNSLHLIFSIQKFYDFNANLYLLRFK